MVDNQTSFIIVRHGAYDVGEEILNERGRGQIEDVADWVSSDFRSATRICESRGPRSHESARILSSRLGLPAGLVAGYKAEEFIQECSTHAQPGDIWVTNGKCLAGAAEHFSKAFKSSNPFSDEIEKGRVFALVCNTSNRSLFRKDFNG